MDSTSVDSPNKVFLTTDESTMHNAYTTHFSSARIDFSLVVRSGVYVWARYPNNHGSW